MDQYFPYSDVLLRLNQIVRGAERTLAPLEATGRARYRSPVSLWAETGDLLVELENGCHTTDLTFRSDLQTILAHQQAAWERLVKETSNGEESSARARSRRNEPICLHDLVESSVRRRLSRFLKPEVKGHLLHVDVT